MISNSTSVSVSATPVASTAAKKPVKKVVRKARKGYSARSSSWANQPALKDFSSGNLSGQVDSDEELGLQDDLTETYRFLCRLPSRWRRTFSHRFGRLYLDFWERESAGENDNEFAVTVHNDNPHPCFRLTSGPVENGMWRRQHYWDFQPTFVLQKILRDKTLTNSEDLVLYTSTGQSKLELHIPRGPTWPAIKIDLFQISATYHSRRLWTLWTPIPVVAKIQFSCELDDPVADLAKAPDAESPPIFLRNIRVLGTEMFNEHCDCKSILAPAATSPEPESGSESELKVEVEAKAEAKSKPESGSESGPESKSESGSGSESEFEFEFEFESESESELKVEAEVESGPEPESAENLADRMQYTGDYLQNLVVHYEKYTGIRVPDRNIRESVSATRFFDLLEFDLMWPDKIEILPGGNGKSINISFQKETPAAMLRHTDRRKAIAKLLKRNFKRQFGLS